MGVLLKAAGMSWRRARLKSGKSNLISDICQNRLRIAIVTALLAACSMQWSSAQSPDMQTELNSIQPELDSLKKIPGFQDAFSEANNFDVTTKENRAARISAVRKAESMTDPGSTPITYGLLEYLEGEARLYSTDTNEAANIEIAIRVLSSSSKLLQALKPDDYRIQAQTLLAIAYLRRLRDDRAANVERAYRILTDISPKISFAQNPCRWTDIQVAMIDVGIDRAYGAQFLNLGASGLELIQLTNLRSSLPADCQAKIDGVAGRFFLHNYLERDPMLHKNTLTSAVNALELSLQHLSSESDPYAWGTTQRDLGKALLGQFLQEPGSDFTEALNALVQSQTVFQPGYAPLEWAASEEVTGDVHIAAGHFDLAESHYRAALQVLTSSVDAFSYRRIHAKIGNSYFDRGRCDMALPDYKAAIDSYVSDPATSYLGLSRSTAAEQMSNIYTDAAYCSAKQGDVATALNFAALSAQKSLGQTIAFEITDMSKLAPTEVSQLQSVTEHLRNLNMQLMATPNPIPEETLQDAKQSQQKLTRLIANAKTEGVDVARTTEEFNFKGIPDGALVLPIITAKGSAILVIPSGASSVGPANVIRIDGFTQNSLQLATGSAPGSVSRSYSDLLEESSRKSVNEFQQTLDKVTAAISPLSVPLAAKLQELGVRPGATVHIISNGLTSLLPFHAAIAGQGGILLDRYAVSYVPNSLALWASNIRDQDSPQTRSYVLIYNPELPAAVLELSGVEQTLTGAGYSATVNATTLSDLSERSASATDMIFVTHGTFDSFDPVNSKIMATINGLAIPDVLQNFQLAHSKIVVLSACDSGMHDIGRFPDQAEGLSEAFLEAGTAHVLATLWPVEDQATAILVSRFYGFQINQRMPVAQALQAAQAWIRKASRQEIVDYLRAITKPTQIEAQNQVELFQNAGNSSDIPFQDSFYWAGFVDIGD